MQMHLSDIDPSRVLADLKELGVRGVADATLVRGYLERFTKLLFPGGSFSLQSENFYDGSHDRIYIAEVLYRAETIYRVPKWTFLCFRSRELKLVPVKTEKVVLRVQLGTTDSSMATAKLVPIVISETGVYVT